ncbi:MAG TPA: peptide deformylase [Nitrososphaera sp.]|nr:peptide deformylase [Nitrososphaera sp.]
MELRTYPDTILFEPTQRVTRITSDFVDIAKRMIDTMYEAQGVGLAAPQIGLGIAMFVWDVGRGPEVVINPSIRRYEGTWTELEGCLSVPGHHWWIERAAEITLHGWDLRGGRISLDADGLEAKVFQHELDHLNGTIILDRITELELDLFIEGDKLDGGQREADN